MRRFVLSLALCYFALMFFSLFSIVITSLAKDKAFHTFVRFALVFFLFVFFVFFSVSSSSWCLGRAAGCYCGTPWTFLLPFFSKTATEIFNVYVLVNTNQVMSRLGKSLCGIFSRIEKNINVSPTLRGIYTLSRKTTLSNCVCPFLKSGLLYKEKKCFQEEPKSFHIEENFFFRRGCYSGKQTGSHKRLT